MDILRQHVNGTLTLGAYALNVRNEAQWICFDADTDEEWRGLWEMATDLKAEHTPSYLEPSQRGGHLWLFLSEPLSGQDARRFARQLAAEQDLPSVEIYPKQDTLRTGPGSLVRLPLDTDARKWLAGSTVNVTQNVTLPANMAAGNYAAYLSLPDAAPTLATRPEYAIQLANTNVWEAATGMNNLNHTMTVAP